MKENESVEKGPLENEEGTISPQRKKSICIKVYVRPDLFSTLAKDAEAAGKRRKGLQLYVQKPHGFANELLANTDGIAKFLKYTWQYWKENEAARLERIAELLKKEKELQEERKKLGLQ